MSRRVRLGVVAASLAAVAGTVAPMLASSGAASASTTFVCTIVPGSNPVPCLEAQLQECHGHICTQ